MLTKKTRAPEIETQNSRDRQQNVTETRDPKSAMLFTFPGTENARDPLPREMHKGVHLRTILHTVLGAGSYEDSWTRTLLQFLRTLQRP